jgi:hypothetical protein
MANKNYRPAMPCDEMTTMGHFFYQNLKDISRSQAGCIS